MSPEGAIPVGRKLPRWIIYVVAVPAGLALIGGLLIAYTVMLIYPKLPPLDALLNYQPQVPLRVYTADTTLIGEFGVERRTPVQLNEVPQDLRLAILAAEDARFYQHGPVDYASVVRAAFADLGAGESRQGASTITMQVARYFFLTREKSLLRKFDEVLLAFKIEHNLTKDQILERYINEISLGQHAFGFAAAAKIYFGKSLGELSLAEAALLAGLPKAPSKYNPISNPSLAAQRQSYVLGRMHELAYVSDAQYQAALKEPLHLRHGQSFYSVDAAYAAELMRQVMVDRYGDQAYTAGYKVYTTLHDADQRAADQAVRQGLLEYDRRHGYRGPEDFVELPDDPAQRDRTAAAALEDEQAVNGLRSALVLGVSAREIRVRLRTGETITIAGAALKFAERALGSSADSQHRLRPGSLVRVQEDGKGNWEIAQLPEAEAALTSLNPKDGAIRALCGGFDFDRNPFNHVTQAYRQPGSSFKPFIYSAALERGFNAATIVDDAPIEIPPSWPGGKSWAPQNFEGNYLGPITMRTALAKSRNTASVRILQAIGVSYAQDYAQRFGFPASQITPYLTMVLGVGTATPAQMAAAYSVFANGGYRVTPYLLQRAEDSDGHVLFEATPERAGEDAPQVIDPRNAFIMTSLMHDVTVYGTAARLGALGRHDLAGKTGSTNNFVDAWFDGFNPGLVAISWIGFDQPRSLGRNEVGARAALPIWMGYMERVLKGVPDHAFVPPAGVVTASIRPKDSERVTVGSDGSRDYFYQENVPPDTDHAAGSQPSDKVRDQLF